jgi:Flp pilus assembly protein TadG
MFRFLCDAVRRLRRDERGNVFVLFGGCAIPLLLVMGGAVDIARYERYKTEFANTVDAAALALAKNHYDYTAAQATTFVTNYVNAFNITDSAFSISSLSVTKLTNGFHVSAVGSMKTIFLPLGKATKGGKGIYSLDDHLEAEVVNSSNRLELALVLDVTGSMNCGNTVSSSCTNDWDTPSSSSRIVALRAAANTLVNTLMTSDLTDPNQIKIGVVPFEGAVNIGATYAANPPSWVDWNDTAQAYWNGRNFAGKTSAGATCALGTAGCNRIGHKWLFNQLTQANSAVKWEGCVEMRNTPYDILDTTPTSATPDTLFVPFFWPDEPDRYSTSSSAAPYQYVNSGGFDTRYNSNYSSSSSNATSTNSSYNYTYMNNYLQDKLTQAYSSSRPATVQSSWAKYAYTSSTNKATWHTSPSTSNQYTAATSFPYAAGPNHGCPQGIVPLTNNKTTITNLLSNLIAYPAMGTFIPNGLIWGWHLLTPNEPFTEGVGSDSQYYDTTVKAIVLFTDGENSVTGASNHNNSYFSGYNYVSQNRLGTTTNATTATSTLDTKTASLCTNIKNYGATGNKIRVYTITFGTISSATQTLMDNCASTINGQNLHYHAPTTSDLQGIFYAIGQDLSNLHLSM